MTGLGLCTAGQDVGGVKLGRNGVRNEEIGEP